MAKSAIYDCLISYRCGRLKGGYIPGDDDEEVQTVPGVSEVGVSSNEAHGSDLDHHLDHPHPHGSDLDHHLDHPWQ